MTAEVVSFARIGVVTDKTPDTPCNAAGSIFVHQSMKDEVKRDGFTLELCV